MNYQTLISAEQLAAALAAGGVKVPVVLDCSFDLADLSAGERIHASGHIAGASYVHLEQSLSAAKTGRNGRHPLPTREVFARTMAALGVSDHTQIVAYDNAAGMYAARLWWMLRWTGHSTVAVLDGGIAAWTAKGYRLATDATPTRPPGRFSLRQSLAQTVDFDAVKANLQLQEKLVLDARAPDRFRGENETMDPVGGHIPGALNRLFRDNLAVDGRFKESAQLRREFNDLTGDRPAAEIIAQCGSGVTACHNLLALEVAQLTGAALYPGSWSEWCAQPDAQIATGTA
jgi:thiosulfate/3-mercaptopyruvate sulfurtransferase